MHKPSSIADLPLGAHEVVVAHVASEFSGKGSAGNLETLFSKQLLCSQGRQKVV